MTIHVMKAMEDFYNSMIKTFRYLCIVDDGGNIVQVVPILLEERKDCFMACTVNTETLEKEYRIPFGPFEEPIVIVDVGFLTEDKRFMYELSFSNSVLGGLQKHLDRNDVFIVENAYVKKNMINDIVKNASIKNNRFVD